MSSNTALRVLKIAGLTALFLLLVTLIVAASAYATSVAPAGASRGANGAGSVTFSGAQSQCVSTLGNVPSWIELYRNGAWVDSLTLPTGGSTASKTYPGGEGVYYAKKYRMSGIRCDVQTLVATSASNCVDLANPSTNWWTNGLTVNGKEWHATQLTVTLEASDPGFSCVTSQHGWGGGTISAWLCSGGICSSKTGSIGQTSGVQHSISFSSGTHQAESGFNSCCMTRDPAGNAVSFLFTKQVGVDLSNPSCTFGGLPSPAYSSNWYKDSVSVGFSSADGETNIKSNEWRLDFGGYTGGTTASTGAEGSHWFECRATNFVDRQGTALSATFQIDNANPNAPSFSGSCSGAGNFPYCQSGAIFSVSATDGGSAKSGVKQITYSGAATGTIGSSSGSISVTSTGSVTASATDNVGHTGPSATSPSVTIDGSPPTCSMSITPGSPAGGGWYNTAQGPVSVSISGSDPSGIWKYEYSYNNVNWSPGQPPADSTTVTRTIYGRAYDNAHNWASCGQKEYKIDATTPSLSASTVSCPGNGVWCRDNAQITYTLTDGNSGPYSITTNIDGEIACGSPCSRTVTVTTTTTVTSSGRDVAGNPVTGAPVSVQIDRIAPTTTASTVDPTTWYTSAVTISFSASDSGGSNGITTWYSVDGLTPYVAGTSKTVSNDGEHYVRFYSTDAAGNVEPVKMVKFKIDSTRPTTTIAMEPALPNGDNQWYRVTGTVTGVKFTVTCTDPVGAGANGTAVSGCNRIEYSDDNQASWKPYPAGGVTTAKEGSNLFFYARSYDNAATNVPGLIASKNYKMDNTAPVVTGAVSAPAPSGWHIAPLTITASISDALSGTGPATIGATCASGISSPATFDIATNGEYTYCVVGKDGAGNPGTGFTNAFKIDRTGPVATIGTKSCTAGPNDWCTSAITVPISAVDNLQAYESGISQVCYRVTVNGVQQQIPTPCLASPATVTLDFQGTIVLYVRGLDKAGNYGTEIPATYKEDTVKPTHTLSPDPAAPPTWIKGCYEGAVTGNDATSGIDVIFWNLDGTGQKTAPAQQPTPVCNSGLHSFVLQARDNAGLLADSTTKQFQVDNIKPTCAVTGFTGGTAGLNGWYTAARTAQFTSADDPGGSGVVAMEYRVRWGANVLQDWKSTDVPSSAQVIPFQGDLTVDCRSFDKAGWVSDIANNGVKHDFTPPTTSISHAPAAPNGAAGWYTVCDTVTITASDQHSGILNVNVNIPGLITPQVITTLPWTQPLCADGVYTITFYATDRAGLVQSPVGTSVVKVDRNAPKTTLTVTGSSQINPPWYNGPFSFTLACNDHAIGQAQAGSGCRKIYYSLNSAAQQEYTGGAVTISADGTHLLEYWSDDNAGLVESPKNSLTVPIDQKAPTVAVSVNCGTPGGDGWCVNPAVVTVTATDPTPGSGLASIVLLLGIGDPPSVTTITFPASGTQKTVTYTVNADQKYSAQAYAADVAGNVGTAGPTPAVAFKVDRTAPQTTVSVNGFPSASNWYQFSPVGFTYTCQETTFVPNSGCLRIETQVDNGTWAGTTSRSFTDGKRWLCHRSVDRAGNFELPVCQIVYVDSVKPISDPPTFTGPAAKDSQDRDVLHSTSRIRLSASDPTPASGVKEIKYTIDGGAPQTYNGASPPGLPGTETRIYQVCWWAIDKALNVESQTCRPIWLDVTPPVVHIARPPPDSITVNDVTFSYGAYGVWLATGPTGGSSRNISADQVPGLPVIGVAIVVGDNTIEVYSKDAITQVASVRWEFEGTGITGTLSRHATAPDLWVGSFRSGNLVDGDHTLRVYAKDQVTNEASHAVEVVKVSVPASPASSGSVDFTPNLVSMINGMNTCAPANWQQLTGAAAVESCVKTQIQNVRVSAGCSATGANAAGQGEWYSEFQAWFAHQFAHPTDLTVSEFAGLAPDEPEIDTDVAKPGANMAMTTCNPRQHEMQSTPVPAVMPREELLA